MCAYNYIDGDDEGINISKTPNDTDIQKHTERRKSLLASIYNCIL